MPTETTLNSLKVHKVPDFQTWENNYDQTNGIGTSDVVVMPPEELKKGVLPSQTSNSGKFLSTNGTSASWETVDALPSQSGNSGKFLTTNGSAASWATVSIPSAADATPLVNGTAAVGTSTDYAREDHVHPTDTSRAASSHAHGNITNGGDITATAPTIASGDQIIINDNSASKITNGPTFDGSTTTSFLSKKGTWETPAGTYTHPSYDAADAAAVKVGRDSTGHVVIGDTLQASDVGAATSSHTHGNITNAGALQTTDITIANGDKLVVTDSSNSSKIARTSVAFDGSTTTKYLSQKGTWETIDALPSQSGNSGKFLTTNGTAASWDTPTDTKNTAGSTDTSSKIYLIGATSQAANPQTYSDNEVYATSGILSAKTFSGTNAELQNIKMVTTLTAITSGRGDLGSSVSPRYLPYEWYASLGHDPVNGEIVVIRTPSAGNTANVYLSINGNTDANYHPIAIGGTTRLTTQFASGTTLMLVYESSMTVATYALAGADSTSTITGIWRVLNFYDSNTNTLLRTYKATNSIELPIVLNNGSASQTATVPSISTYKDSYGAIANTNSPTINPSTGVLTANSPNFTGIPVAPTAMAGTNTTQIATTAFVNTAVSNIDALPSQSGNSGKYLTTNGSVASWATVLIPSTAAEINFDDTVVQAGSNTVQGAIEILVNAVDSCAASIHTHGNITNGGDITATAPTIASGDQIIINDHSASKITNGPTFDGSTTTKYLSQKGTWESVPDVSAAIAGLGSVLNYRGTKTAESGLPTTGNTAGDVWIVTADNSEYVWDGTNWEKLGPTIDLSGYVPTSRKVNGKALSSDVTISVASGSTGISISDHSTTTIYGVTSSTTTASKASGGNGTAPTLGTAISVPNVTAVGSGSFTSGTFSGGSGSFSATVTNHVLSFSHSHTAATHGADSHTHTAPTLGTAISVPNVTSVGSASTWSFTDVTVPVKNSSSTTVVTSKTHSITDNGHTHTLN